jgi:hypothetical protein
MSKKTYKIDTNVIVEDNQSSRFPALIVHPEYPGDPEKLLEVVAKAMNEYADTVSESKGA